MTIRQKIIAIKIIGFICNAILMIVLAILSKGNTILTFIGLALLNFILLYYIGKNFRCPKCHNKLIEFSSDPDITPKTCEHCGHSFE